MAGVGRYWLTHRSSTARRTGRCPYSGSEGEMFRKGFSTVVAAACCGNPAVIRAEPRGPVRTYAAVTNRRARHSMSEDRTQSGWCTSAAPQFKIARLFTAVQYGRLDSAGAPRLRIALPDTRCPRIELRAAGMRFASKTNTQMSSGSGLKRKRLYYKAFVEAKLPAPSLFLREES